jgi:hypothetical protein
MVSGLGDIDEAGALAVGTYTAGFFWQESRENFNPSTAQPEGLRVDPFGFAQGKL